MPPCTLNPRPLTGVVSRTGREWELYCADDGGYWWVCPHNPTLDMGPFGLDEPDAMKALDIAFAHLS